jgi:porin
MKPASGRQLAIWLVLILCIGHLAAQDSNNRQPGHPKFMPLKMNLANNFTQEISAFRNNLLKNGVELFAVYTSDYVANLRGGLSRRGGYLYNMDVAALIDANVLLGLKNTSMFIYAVGNGGDDPTAYVGDFQGTSNIEAPDSWKLYEMWFEYLLNRQRTSLKLGIMDLNADFYVTENATSFINSSFGIGAEIAQTGVNGPSIFPVTALALRMRHQFDEQKYLQMAVFDAVAGNPNDLTGTHIHWIDPDEGFLLIGETGRLRPADGDNLFQKLALGAWHYTSKFEVIGKNGLRERGNQGIYLIAEQQIRQNPLHPEKGITLFANFGLTKSKFNPIHIFYNGGLVWRGLDLVNGDETGLAFTTVIAGNDFMRVMESEQVSASRHETIVEWFYRFTPATWLLVQPDIQWVINPGLADHIPNALVFTVRMGIEL